MAQAKPKNSAAAFRSLEAELSDLYRDVHQTTEEAAAKAEAMAAEAEARIKDICNLVNFAADPLFGERFIHRLTKRYRSSADAVEYAQQRDSLLVQAQRYI